MSGSYKKISGQYLTTYQQLAQKKGNTNVVQSHRPQIKIIPLTEQDRDYLTYFRDVFLDGKKYSIQKDKDWKQMPDNDLRRNVYSLLEDIFKKNYNIEAELNKIHQINFDKTKQLNFYASIYQFFSHLEQQNFYNASLELQKNLNWFPTLLQLLGSVSKKFQKLKGTQLNFQKLQKKNKFYENILNSMDNIQVLDRQLLYASNKNEINDSIKQKINQQILRLKNYKNQPNQNDSFQLLKQFLGVLGNDFAQQNVNSLLNQASKLNIAFPDNKTLIQTLRGIEKYCQIKRNQSASKSNISNSQTTVTSRNSTKDENLSYIQSQSNKDDQKYHQKIKDLQSSINNQFQFIMQRAIKITTRGNKSLQINQLKFQQLRQNILSKLNQGFQLNQKSSQKSLSSGSQVNQQRFTRNQNQNNQNNRHISHFINDTKQQQQVKSSKQNIQNEFIEVFQQKITVKQLIERFYTLSKDYHNNQNEITSLKEYQITNISQIVKKNNQLQSLRNQLKKQKKQISNKDNQINSFNQQKRKYEQQINGKFKQLRDAYQGKFKKLQHQYNNKHNLIQDLKSQNKQKQDEITYLRNNNKNMKNGLIEYQQKYSQSQNQIVQLKTIIASFQENKQTLEKQIKQKTQNINELLRQEQKNKLQDKIIKLHDLCNLKDIQIINLKQLNTKISEDLKKLNLYVQYNKERQEEKNKTQTQLVTGLNQLNTELKIKTAQNEGLISQITCLNVEITSKNNEVFLKESEIRALKNKQQQFNSKITKYEAYMTQKDQKLQKITNQLKEKSMVIKDLENKILQTASKNTIESIPDKKKQPQEQQRKPIIQTKTANFRSFNNRQKSNAKNMTSSNKVVSKSPTKNSQIKINLLTVQSNKQSNLPPIKQKIDHQSQKQQNDKKSTLKIQPKVFNQEIKDNNQNQKSKQIYQSPNIDNKLNQIKVSLKKKSQSQWTNQVKQKESKISSLNQQIIRLNSTIQSLNTKVEETSKQNSLNKQEVEKLIKSNQKLRESQRKCIQLQSQIIKIKEQKQLIQGKLKQITSQLQSHQNNQNNILEDNKQLEIEKDELKKLQQDLGQKYNQIAQMQKTITNLSQQVSNLKEDKMKLKKTNQDLEQKYNNLSQQFSNLEKDKMTLQKTIQDLQKKQQETIQIKTSKSQIKSTGNLKGKNEQNNPQLQAYKKQMKVKILQLELDLDQKQQHYQEMKEKHKKQIITLKNQIQSLTSATPGLQTQISNLKNELQKKSQTLNNKQKEVESLHAKISELQTLMQKQNEDTQRFVEQIKDLKKENESMERQLTKLCDGRDKLESENNSLIDKYRNQQKLHKEEIDKMKKDQAAQIRSLRLENARQVQEIRRQIKSAQYSQKIKSNTQKQGESNVLMKMEHEKLKRQYESHQKSNKEMQQVIKDMEMHLKSLQNTLKQKEQQIKNLQDKNRHLQQLMRQLEKKLAPMKGGLKQISTIIFDRFFQNEALYQQFYKKYLLYDLIQLQTKKTIKSTTLLYRLDKLNKVNFHEYVDCVNNVVAIIKTSNGNIFGGFSTSKIEKGYRQPAGTVSFIFTFDSPNTIEHFTLDEKKKLNLKSFDWDEYFFVFGNAEIRWRFGERKIYSNFAINNGYYETKGKDVSALLQQGSSRETAIVALDFYQVQFEQ